MPFACQREALAGKWQVCAGKQMAYFCLMAYFVWHIFVRIYAI